MSLAILTFFEAEFKAAETTVFGAARKVETVTVAAIKDIPGFLDAAAKSFASMGLSIADLGNIFNAVRAVSADLGGNANVFTKAQAVVNTLQTVPLPAGAQAAIHQVVTTAQVVIDAKAVIAAALANGTALTPPPAAPAAPATNPAAPAPTPTTTPAAA